VKCCFYGLDHDPVPKNKKSRPTMREVAEATGLSIGTVSEALRNKAGVAPETRARVLEAAAEMGYAPRRNTTSTAKAPSIIGLLLKLHTNAPMTINPFYSYVLAGAERECQRQGLGLMYSSAEVDEYNRFLNFPTMLSDRRVDGALIVGTLLEKRMVEHIQQAGYPVILVDSYTLGQSIFDSVVTDNVNGAYSAVKYLIEKGHTRIGLLGSMPDAYPSVKERREGYCRALSDFGISESYIENGLLTLPGGYEAALRLLRRSPEITAVFACNDEVAKGTINAANEMGIRVPDDLSVVGFDNSDMARQTTPSLTTIHVDKTSMGIMAVQLLVDRIENPDRAIVTTMLGTKLVERESVRPLA
jgi:LacI family transcriptional regulator